MAVEILTLVVRDENTIYNNTIHPLLLEVIFKARYLVTALRDVCRSIFFFVLCPLGNDLAAKNEEGSICAPLDMLK